jgi:uncharacterized membrane protein
MLARAVSALSHLLSLAAAFFRAHFTAPIWLLAIPLAVFLLLIRWRGRADLPGWRRVVGWVARPLALVAVLVALAGPRFALGIDRQRESVLFVLDASASIDPADEARATNAIQTAIAQAPSDARIGVEVFGGVPSLVLEPGAGRTWVAPPEVDPEATDLASAIRLAHGTLASAPGRRRIVLLTDGRATRGDVMAEVASAKADDIQVDVAPIGSDGGYDARVVSVTPDSPIVQPGETVQASVTVAASGDGPVHVTVTRSAEGTRPAATVLDQTVSLKAGAPATLSFTDPVPSDELGSQLLYDAAVDPGRDQRTRLDDHGVALVLVSGRTRVLVVAKDPDQAQPLQAALTSAGLLCDVRGMDRFPDDALELDGFDAAILDDVPLERPDEVADPDDPALSHLAQERLANYVETEGGGLVAIGGTSALGDDYKASKLEAVLPVQTAPDQTQNVPVAMAIVLDRSGSMSDVGDDGVTIKMTLADEAAAAAGKMLRPQDVIGVQATDSVPVWYVPLQPRSGIDDKTLESRVMSIDVGDDGIFVYTALRSAYAELQKQTTPVKHVLMFADAADAVQETADASGSPTALQVAQTAARAGIGLSVVGIGVASDSDVGYLKSLAAAGGGKFYLTANGHTLKTIFVDETRRITGDVDRNEKIRVVESSPADALKGVDVDGAPELGGYVVTQAKPTAEVPLETTGGDPVLATWRYGLGQVAAFTSAADGDWAKGWMKWHGYRVLWPQLVRAVARQRATSRARATLSVADGQGTLDVSLASDDTDPAPPMLQASVYGVRAGGGSTLLPVSLTEIAPGSYAGRFDASGDAVAYVARVTDAGGAPMTWASAVAPPAAEIAATGPDAQAIAAIAQAGGGRDGVTLDALLVPGSETAQRVPESIAPFLLALAALLIPIDLLVRRRVGRV